MSKIFCSQFEGINYFFNCQKIITYNLNQFLMSLKRIKKLNHLTTSDSNKKQPL